MEGKNEEKAYLSRRHVLLPSPRRCRVSCSSIKNRLCLSICPVPTMQGICQKPGESKFDRLIILVMAKICADMNSSVWGLPTLEASRRMWQTKLVALVAGAGCRAARACRQEQANNGAGVRSVLILLSRELCALRSSFLR